MKLWIDPHTQIILEMRREVRELVREAQKFSRGRVEKTKEALLAEAGKLRVRFVRWKNLLYEMLSTPKT